MPFVARDWCYRRRHSCLPAAMLLCACSITTRAQTANQAPSGDWIYRTGTQCTVNTFRFGHGETSFLETGICLSFSHSN